MNIHISYGCRTCPIAIILVHYLSSFLILFHSVSLSLIPCLSFAFSYSLFRSLLFSFILFHSLACSFVLGGHIPDKSPEGPTPDKIPSNTIPEQKSQTAPFQINLHRALFQIRAQGVSIPDKILEGPIPDRFRNSSSISSDTIFLVKSISGAPHTYLSQQLTGSTG